MESVSRCCVRDNERDEGEYLFVRNGLCVVMRDYVHTYIYEMFVWNRVQSVSVFLFLFCVELIL